ncbi:hypothetical protein LTR95_008482 [Oleoguttula sp. CCFEE 5521]
MPQLKSAPAPSSVFIQALRVLLIRACESWSHDTRLQRSHPTLAQILAATPDNKPLSERTKSLALTYILETLPARIAALNPSCEDQSPLSEINATLLSAVGGKAESVYMKGHFNKLLLGDDLRQAIDAVESEITELETQRMHDLGTLRALVLGKNGTRTAEEVEAVVSAMLELGLDVNGVQAEADGKTRDRTQGTRTNDDS